MKAVILKTSLKQLANKIFPFASRLESVTYMAPAGSGKRTLMKHALSDTNLIRDYFKVLHTYLFVFVDTEDLVGVSQIDYLRLMRVQLHKELKTENTLSHSADEFVLESLRTMMKTTVKKYKIIWIINNIEYLLSHYPSLFDNLLSLKHEFPDSCSFVFLSTINVASESVLKKVRDSKFEITKNLAYHPILSHEEAIKFAYAYARVQGSPYSRSEIEELCNLTGGHVLTIRIAVDRLTQLSRESAKPSVFRVLDDYHVDVVCADIWTYLHEEERDYLYEITRNKNYALPMNAYARYLIKTGLIKKTTSGWVIFSKLFEQFIRTQPNVTRVAFNTETNQLMWRVKSLEDVFTKQEYSVLELLVKREEEIVSRDDIADTLWGEKSYDKYSDWAIDKTVSMVRKKLLAVGLSEGSIKTVKKRGFKWVHK